MAKNKKKARSAEPAEKKAREEYAVITGNPVRNLLIATLASIVLGGVLIGATFAYASGMTAAASFISSAFGYLMGALVLILGVVFILVYVARPAVKGEYRYEFGIGLAAVITGLYIGLGGLLFGGEDFSVASNIIYRVLGIMVLADGILKVQYALDTARMKFGGWWLVLVMGILSLAVGVVVILGIAYNFGASMGFGGACGIGAGLALNGILDLVALIAVAVCNKHVRFDAPVEAPVFDDYYSPAEEPEPAPMFPDEPDGGAFTLDVEPEEPEAPAAE